MNNGARFMVARAAANRAAILDAARRVAAAGGTPTATAVARITGLGDPTVRRHREALMAEGHWPWPVEVGRPHAPSPPLATHPAAVEADCTAGDRRVLACARALEAEGRRPTAYEVARRLGLHARDVSHHRDRLRGAGLWPWPIAPSTPGGRPGMARDTPRDPDPTVDGVAALAAELKAEALGRCDRPAPAAQVARKAAEELRRQVRRYHLEWRALVRGWVAYGRDAR